MNIARLRKLRGFTLIELIVVIVIMGILVAIGAFAYNAIISSSRADAVEKVAGQAAKTLQADSAANQKGYGSYTANEVYVAPVAGPPAVPAAGILGTDLDRDHRAVYVPSTRVLTITNSTNNCAARVTFGTSIGSAAAAVKVAGSCS